MEQTTKTKYRDKEMRQEWCNIQAHIIRLYIQFIL